MNANNEVVVEQLIALVTQGNAHITFEESVANIPFDILGVKPQNLPYSIWQLAEHIKIAQWDILEFSRNAHHTSPKWPEEYWPTEDGPANEEAWQKTLDQIQSDKMEFITLLTAEGADLYTPFEYGDGQNLLREAMLIADHTSYHTGQIILIRRLLNNWSN